MALGEFLMEGGTDSLKTWLFSLFDFSSNYFYFLSLSINEFLFENISWSQKCHEVPRKTVCFVLLKD